MSASRSDESRSVGVVDRFGAPWAAGIQTMLHEFGHLHSRRHAPCGGASGTDPNYPWADGKHGPEPLYSSTYADVLPGAMSRRTCKPIRLRRSDLCPTTGSVDLDGLLLQLMVFNVQLRPCAKVPRAPDGGHASQRRGRHERRRRLMRRPARPRSVTLCFPEYWPVRRDVAPAQILPFAPIAPQSGGPYSMAIRTVAGEVIKVDFAAPDVSHDAAKSFTVLVPDPGPVAGSK